PCARIKLQQTRVVPMVKRCFRICMRLQLRANLASPAIGSHRFRSLSVYFAVRSLAMKKISAIALGALFSLAIAPQLGAAPQFSNQRDRGQGRDRVCFYKDIHYQGWEQCYAVGDEVNSLGDRKAAASSLRVFGRARVTVYDKTGFDGRTTEFTSDVP